METKERLSVYIFLNEAEKKYYFSDTLENAAVPGKFPAIRINDFCAAANLRYVFAEFGGPDGWFGPAEELSFFVGKLFEQGLEQNGMPEALESLLLETQVYTPGPKRLKVKQFIPAKKQNLISRLFSLFKRK